MVSVMARWTRRCCGTSDTICLSSPRSTSDMGPQEEGQTKKNTCTAIWKYLQRYYFTHCVWQVQHIEQVNTKLNIVYFCTHINELKSAPL